MNPVRSTISSQLDCEFAAQGKVVVVVTAE